MRIKILLVLFGVLLVSCNTQASDERKIKRTMAEFLNAVEREDTDKYKSLIYEGEGLHMEQLFFYKNYKKINSMVDLKKNINIKDTIWGGARMKCVQYHINSNNSKPPLIITFIFYKRIGYDKIVNDKFFKNMLDWE